MNHLVKCKIQTNVCTVTGTNNRAPRWTFTDPCKPEVRPGAREEPASPGLLAAHAMNARDTTKVYIWRLNTRRGPTLYRKFFSRIFGQPSYLSSLSSRRSIACPNRMSLYIFLLYYIYHLCFTCVDFYDLFAWGGCWFVVFIRLG